MVMSVWVLSVQSRLLDVDNNGMKRGKGDSWRLVQPTTRQVPTRKGNSVVSDKNVIQMKHFHIIQMKHFQPSISTQGLMNSKQQKFEIYSVKGNMFTNKY